MEDKQDSMSPNGIASFTMNGKGGSSPYYLMTKVKEPDIFNMPRGLSLKKKSKEAEPSPLKDDGRYIIQQDGDDEQYSIAELAKKYFRNPGYPPHFTRTEIKQPLLKSTPDEMREVVLKLWRVLLVFTKDIPDYRRNLQSTYQPNFGSVMTRMYREIGVIPADADLAPQSPVLEKTTGFREHHLRQLPAKPQKNTLTRLRATLSHRLSIGTRKSIFHTLPFEQTLRSPLEQIHYIIGYCILKPELRDEVYCHVCKQLMKNPLKDSVNRYWLFMGLLIGSFQPSPWLVPYVQKVIAESPPMSASVIGKLLQRTLDNGVRCQPPAHIEIQSALEKRLVELQITFMDGTNQSLVVDAATSSKEVVQKLCDRIGLKLSFGFSLYISMLSKVASLGSGSDHILDAVSQCEQMFRDQDGEEEKAPVRLFFRKEVFSPWDDFSSDLMATNLIFAQVTRGILLNEYSTESDQDLAVLAAQQYYIDYGESINEDSLAAVLPSYIPPDRRQNESSLKQWHKLVVKAYRKLFDSRDKLPSEHRVKTDLIHFARKKWVTPFSKLHDVIRLEGPYPIDEVRVKLGINSEGIFIITEEGSRVVTIPFEQISVVTGEKEGRQSQEHDVPIVLIALHTGMILKLGSMDSPAIRDDMNYMMDGSRQRSVWALAKDTYYGDNDGELNVEEGDLLHLKCKAKDGALKNKHAHARNTRTDQEGVLLSEYIHVLPTEHCPTEDFVNLHNSTRQRRSTVNFNENIQEIPRMDVLYETDSEGFQHSPVRIQESLPSTGSSSPAPGPSNGHPKWIADPVGVNGTQDSQATDTNNSIQLLGVTETETLDTQGSAPFDDPNIPDSASPINCEIPGIESIRL